MAMLKQEAQLMLTNPCNAFGGQSRSPNVVSVENCKSGNAHARYHV